MKTLTSVLTVSALSFLVVAHGGDNLQARRHNARQAYSISSSHPSSTTSITPGPLPTNSANATLTANSTTSTLNYTITFLSTNPTAYPLSSIVSNQSSLPTMALTTTETPGPGPTNIPGAPPLPNILNLQPSNYPKLDVTPPTDSPQVLQWIQEVQDTGIEIPDFPPTNPGGCPNNTAILGQAGANGRCWWTCGGCVRITDIVECPTAMDWGLTYDDGPSYYTPNLLQYLDQQKLKSTFFIVGSRGLQFPRILQLEFMSYHQIAVHTWSHPPMTTLTNEEIISELGWTKEIIRAVIGLTPNIWRPPYGDVDDRVRAIAIAMGLTTVIWSRNNETGFTYDTGDFNIPGGTVTSFQALQNWYNIVASATSIPNGIITLQHDLFEQTVELAVGYILPNALATKPPFTITPIVVCLNMPMANAYIETNNNQSNPPVISGPYVTTTHVPSRTGSSTKPTSSSVARFSAGFSLMFTMTAVTLLAGVCAVHF